VPPRSVWHLTNGCGGRAPPTNAPRKGSSVSCAGHVLVKLVERPGRKHEPEAMVRVVRKARVLRVRGDGHRNPRVSRKFFNLWRKGIVAETRWALHAHAGHAIDMDRDGPPPPVRRGMQEGNAKQLRCSFCQAELGEDRERTTPGFRARVEGTATSMFCSTYCRDCVLALAALHPSPLASSDFVSKRALLTDRLLDLWRRGQGPDPALVLQAAKATSCGLEVADASD
jgi:hypothetical protein